jgi:hypothetical protein
MELPPAQTIPPAAPLGQPPAKSNTTKIIIIVVAVLAVLCLVACAVIAFFVRNVGQRVGQSVKSDPAAVNSATQQIASIDLPEGYTPTSSMNILGMTMVVYEGSNKNSALVLIQMPTTTELTEANIKQMEEQMQNQSGRRLQNYKVIKEYDATIRGKPGKVIIQEGESSDGGDTMRQMMVVFQGKSGLAMMMIIGPANQWDQSAYDAMVKSIK